MVVVVGLGVVRCNGGMVRCRKRVFGRQERWNLDYLSNQVSKKSGNLDELDKNEGGMAVFIS